MPPDQELKLLIVAELELQNLPDEDQDTIVRGVAQNVRHALRAAVLARLPDDRAREKFGEIDAAGDMVALKAYARTHIDGFDQLMERVVREEIEAHK